MDEFEKSIGLESEQIIHDIENKIRLLDSQAEDDSDIE